MIKAIVKDRLGVITLNRPEKRNAFHPELIKSMHDQVQTFNKDRSIRAILFTGEGEAFSAGADLAYLQELRSFSIKENEADSKALSDLFESIYNSPKLTFSAVDGYALAGGCGLATITDFCFATIKAKFGYTEAMIGFVPAIVMVYLMRKINGTALNKLVLTADIIDAKQAEEIGLVSKIMDFENFYNDVEDEIRRIIMRTSAQSITMTKELMRKNYDLSIDEALSLAVKTNAKARSTEDCINGVNAFLNKEKLSW